MNAPRFCVVGADSAIGAALLTRLADGGAPAVGSTRRHISNSSANLFPLDLLDTEHCALPPCDVLVIAAAMTRLADCRAQPAAAYRANVVAPARLAKLAAASGAFVVFLSTSQVFDGAKPVAKVSDRPTPQSVYGRLKAEAEACMTELGEQAAVVRLGKTIGLHLQLFQDWRARLAAGRTVHAFDDLMMSPICISKVAFGLEQIGLRRLHGVWHLGGREDMSYFDAARRLADRLGVSQTLVLRGSAREQGIPAEERPPHTVLDTDATAEAIGLTISDAFGELDIGLGFESWSPGSRTTRTVSTMEGQDG
jgi:dTDP-4-dehydrorhamnose reductase